MALPKDDPNRYQQIIEEIFFGTFKKGLTEISFEREEIIAAAEKLQLEPIKNVGDLIYAIRYRMALPSSILETQPEGMEWIIEGAGRAKYLLKLVKVNRILPNPNLIAIKIPDATPEIISAYSLSDEQALLAKVRYNRLLDIFLGIASYSLQNHLRTSVRGIGQVEIDEIYVGVDRNGCQYVVPVQAKGGTDQLSVVQTQQDLRCCAEKFPGLVCRAISTQFMTDDLIAVFELDLEGDEIRIVDEKHYRLVPANKISKKTLEKYARRRD
ncbi:MAG: endonuclease [Verrucomicrobia bacterium]|nr:endonuclease [Verrucomicrobiota bacterium]MDA1005779.1 endonuclease [Verrucomicrobiota bacterium]